MTAPRCSIIILNYNRPDLTIECVESVMKNSYANYEIIVVDNGSKDNSVKTLSDKFPGIRIISNGENLGFSEGNNIGIRLALQGGADYVVLLNNDTTVDKSFLSPLVDTLEADKNAAAAGPLIFFNDNPDIIWAAGGKIRLSRPSNNMMGKRFTRALRFEKNVDFLSGCCLMLRTSLLKETGLLDPEYFLYYEDVDLCLRIKKLGYALMFVPASIIWHKGSVTTGNVQSPIVKYYGTRNRLLLTRKHAGLFTRVFFYSMILPYLLLKNTILLARKPASLRALYIGLADGLSGRFGKAGNSL